MCSSAAVCGSTVMWASASVRAAMCAAVCGRECAAVRKFVAERARLCAAVCGCLRGRPQPCGQTGLYSSSSSSSVCGCACGSVQRQYGNMPSSAAVRAGVCGIAAVRAQQCMCGSERYNNVRLSGNQHRSVRQCVAVWQWAAVQQCVSV
jgi:hypothetical protein